MENLENLEGKNGELSDSWTLVKESETEEGDEPQKVNSEIIQSSEDSDGSISVISETELGKTTSENEVEKCEQDDEGVEALPEFELPITPPITPKIDSKKQNKIKPCSITDGGYRVLSYIYCVLSFFFFFFIVLILLGQMYTLKADYQQQIRKLKDDNEYTNAFLDFCQRENDDIFEKYEKESLKVEKLRKLPLTKEVWLGNEVEEKVEVLNNLNELPHYCYHNQEDDLFYEHNQEVCDKKRRKLEKFQNTKEEKPLKVNWDDDVLCSTLKAIQDDINAMKQKFPEKDKISEITEKLREEKPKFSSNENQEKSQRKKQKIKDDCFIEERVMVSQGPRKRYKKQADKENFHLKKKNEREHDRFKSGSA